MGKTYRDVSIISYDDSREARKARKKEIRSIRHSIRDNNRKSDECTYIKK